jgi:hypothetical protein
MEEADGVSTFRRSVTHDIALIQGEVPAHEAVRNRLVKERREIDARLRAPIGREAQQVRPVVSVEVRTTA